DGDPFRKERRYHDEDAGKVLFCRWSAKFCNVDYRRPRSARREPSPRFLSNRTCSRYVKIDANSAPDRNNTPRRVQTVLDCKPNNRSLGGSWRRRLTIPSMIRRCACSALDEIRLVDIFSRKFDAIRPWIGWAPTGDQ